MKILCTECGKEASWESHVGAYVHDAEEGTHDVAYDAYDRLRALTGLTVSAADLRHLNENKLAEHVVELVETALAKLVDEGATQVLHALTNEYVEVRPGDTSDTARLRAIKTALAKAGR